MKYHEQLLEVIKTAKVKLLTIDEVTFEYKKKGKWSKKEIIGHLIDSCFNNYARFVKATEQEKLVYVGYNQTDLVIKNQYQKRSSEELINTWFALNQQVCFLIENISIETLKRKTIFINTSKTSVELLEKEGKDTLSYLIWDYIAHMEHHLTQVIDDYECINLPFIKPN